MLFEAHPEIDIHEMSPLALAFAGDAVLELLVRQRLVETSRLQPGRLHSVATHYVSAHAQNQELALIEPMLTEEEQNILRRGKNASKASVAKHATAQEYRASTGFECLLGCLHLMGRDDRIEELFETIWKIIPRNNKCLCAETQAATKPVPSKRHRLFAWRHNKIGSAVDIALP